MSETTNISFAHHTGSPWIGCTKVNDDCANCYADWIDEKRFSKTLGGATKENPQRHWGKGKPRVRTIGFWDDARKWNAKPWVVQCEAAGVLPYVKQLGSCCICDNVNVFDWPNDDVALNDSPHAKGFAAGQIRLRHKSGADMAEWPEFLHIQKLPEAH